MFILSAAYRQVTVVNMQSLKQLSVLILGLSIYPLLVRSYGPPSSSGSVVSKNKQPDKLVDGHYWWMETDAFGDSSDTQVKEHQVVEEVEARIHK